MRFYPISLFRVKKSYSFPNIKPITESMGCSTGSSDPNRL